MTDTEILLRQAEDEKRAFGDELIRMTRHYMKLQDIVDKYRRQLDNERFKVRFHIDETTTETVEMVAQ